MSRKGIIFLAPFFVLLLVLLGIFKFDLLLIKNIEVDINSANCLDGIDLKSLIALEGENIFLINDTSIEKKLTENYHCIKDIKLAKIFPHKVKLTIDGRRDLARIAKMTTEATSSSRSAFLDWTTPYSTESSFYVVDELGYVFKKTESTTSPLIYTDTDTLEIGSRFSSEIFKKISVVLHRLKENGLFNPNLEVQSRLGEDIFLVKNAEKLIFSLKKDIFGQLGSLQLILQKAKIEGKVVESVDLRFDKPVVVYGKR